jgi:hypothetical protein
MLGVEAPACGNTTYLLNEHIEIFKDIIYRQLPEHREQAAPVHRARGSIDPPALPLHAHPHARKQLIGTQRRLSAARILYDRTV